MVEIGIYPWECCFGSCTGSSDAGWGGLVSRLRTYMYRIDSMHVLYEHELEDSDR